MIVVPIVLPTSVTVPVTFIATVGSERPLATPFCTASANSATLLTSFDDLYPSTPARPNLTSPRHGATTPPAATLPTIPALCKPDAACHLLLKSLKFFGIPAALLSIAVPAAATAPPAANTPPSLSLSAIPSLNDPSDNPNIEVISFGACFINIIIPQIINALANTLTPIGGIPLVELFHAFHALFVIPGNLVINHTPNSTTVSCKNTNKNVDTIPFNQLSNIFFCPGIILVSIGIGAIS